MKLSEVHNWIFFFGGYRQDSGGAPGVLVLADYVNRLNENHPLTRIQFREWDDNPEPIAQRVFQQQPQELPVNVISVGYSYGGFTSNRFCQELDYLGIKVYAQVLVDAVWRMFDWLPSPRSMLGWKPIKIATNVEHLYSFHQDSESRWEPQGHPLIVSEETQWHTPDSVDNKGMHLLNTSHWNIDENKMVRDTVLQVCEPFLRRYTNVV